MKLDDHPQFKKEGVNFTDEEINRIMETVNSGKINEFEPPYPWPHFVDEDTRTVHTHVEWVAYRYGCTD